jgi:hypothetical protein
MSQPAATTMIAITRRRYPDLSQIACKTAAHCPVTDIHTVPQKTTAHTTSTRAFATLICDAVVLAVEYDCSGGLCSALKKEIKTWRPDLLRA